MKHSRPGFATRTTDDAPAKLNEDMIPALHKQTAKSAAEKTPSAPAVLQARAEEMHARMVVEAQLLAARGGDVLVNPNPSATPILTSPHKDE